MLVFMLVFASKKECVNRTRMTRIERTIADKTEKRSAIIRSIHVIRVLLARTPM